MTSRPWAKFFWNDWQGDPCLRVCSLAAQGLWMRMLCLAAEADPTGYVTIAGRAVTSTDLARLTGETEQAVQSLLAELELNGVFSRNAKGMIYSRRMVREVKKSAIARKNGRNGGNPTLCSERGNTASDNPTLNHRDKPHKPEARSQTKGEVSTSPSRGTRLPDGAVLPDEWGTFALQEGHPNPEREWLKFTDYWRAQPGQKGVKVDWFGTWRNWVRRAVENGAGTSGKGRTGNPFVALSAAAGG